MKYLIFICILLGACQSSEKKCQIVCPPMSECKEYCPEED